jgi:hypothetical protein
VEPGRGKGIDQPVGTDVVGPVDTRTASGTVPALRDQQRPVAPPRDRLDGAGQGGTTDATAIASRSPR